MAISRAKIDNKRTKGLGLHLKVPAWGFRGGQKQYELTNHLGNVLVTVSDKKLPVDTTITPNIAQYYLPEIISSQDYYPFGMIEPGRQYSLLKYNYLFNGKLHDDEMYSPDVAYDYGMRMYDARLGRFLSIDPLAKEYPMLSSYQYASLSPCLLYTSPSPRDTR